MGNNAKTAMKPNLYIRIAALSSAIALSWGCSPKPFEDGTHVGNTYAVKNIGGVPFITSDGHPIRGRIFYGSFPGEKRKVVGTEPTEVSIDFVSENDDPNGALRMSFETKIKDIYILEAALEDLDGKTKQILYDTSSPEVGKNFTANKSQYSAKNENGALHIQKSNDPIAGAVKFYIGGLKIKKGVKYRLKTTLKYSECGWFDMVVYTQTPFEIIGQSAGKTFVSQQKLAAERGINLVTLGIPIFWDEKNAKNYEKIYDNIFKNLSAVNPDVKVIARVGMNPSAEWLDKNPDSEMRDFDGKTTTRISRGAEPSLQRFAAVSSEKYRADASKALRQTIALLESKYGKYIAGYHPSGANTGEWFYAQSPTARLSGYDKSTLAAWRKWLAKKYPSDEDLKTAWNNPAAELKNAPVPSNEERSNLKCIINPETHQNVVDFNLFLQDEMADTILTFAKIIREETKANPKLSLTFYGYGFEFAALHNSPAVTGHFALRKILDSPYIDMVCGPISYSDRGKGGSKSTMGASESCALSNKIWCDEDDNRTYLMWSSGSVILVGDPNQKTQADSIEVMRRNLAQQTLRNHASWWMDLFGTGWYEDPELWKQMDLFKSAELDMINNPSPYSPPVALIYDETSMCYVGRNSSRLTGMLMKRARLALNRCGVPFGQYLLDDILEGRATPRMNVFLCAFALDEKRRKQMRKVAENSACLWAWAPGYVDTQKRKLSVEAISETTGFEIMEAGNLPSKFIPTEEGKKAGLKLFNEYAPVGVYFSPKLRDGDTVLYKYSNGLPAVVMRKNGKYPHIFCGMNVIPIELYRYAFKESGIHIYTEQPAAVYANGAYVSVCATTSEPHTIDVGTDETVYDALTGTPLGKGPVLKFDMKKGDVKFLRIGKGNK